MNERRKHPRYELKRIVTAAVRIKNSKKVMVFSLLNISLEGMLIAGELDASELKNNDLVLIELFSDDPRRLIVSFEAVVIDFRGDGKFGIHIPVMSDSERRKMINQCADTEKSE